MAQGCTFRLENQYAGPVCGLDEVGRGPLAGPVMAACVFIPAGIRRKRFWSDVTDSKQVSSKKREELYSRIIEHCAFGIAEASVEEIDRINILQASLLAMTRAFENMLSSHAAEVKNWVALVDGNQKPHLPCAVQTVIQGDAISRSIAAASILAKVTRDRHMRNLCALHPGYGWSTNAGYGTREHLEGLKRHGITIHHRRSFAPVQMRMLD